MDNERQFVRTKFKGIILRYEPVLNNKHRDMDEYLLKILYNPNVFIAHPDINLKKHYVGQIDVLDDWGQFMFIAHIFESEKNLNLNIPKRFSQRILDEID
jgi:hypothetical protein